MSEERKVQSLIEEAQTLRYSRRQILRRAAVFGISATGIAAVLAACGGGSNATTTSQAAATSAPTTGTGAATKASPAATTGVTSASPAASPAKASTGAYSLSTTPVAAANLKGAKLNILAGTYFVAAAQDLFTKQAKEWGTANGVNVSVDYVAWTDLQAKIGAGIQSSSGPDIVELWDTWPFLYYQNLVDVSDMVEEMGQAQDGFYDWVTKTVQVDGKWYSVPSGTSGSAFNYRTSYFKQAGADTFPDTWEDLFTVAKKLKEMGKPLGQALGHSTGDPPSFAYSYLWAYGGMEVKEDGKTVAINVPQFVDGLSRFIQAWKDGYDESGLSWDDGANNRAFLSDQISGTLNGDSIYIAALKDEPDIADDMNHAAYPKGPAGRFNNLGSHSYGLFKYSKNQEAGKEFLKWWFSKDPFGEWLKLQNSYQIGPTKMWETADVYSSDPKLKPYSELATYARSKGYAGPSDQKAALAFSKYIVVDTFARAIQSGKAQDAINWGTDQLKQIYSK